MIYRTTNLNLKQIADSGQCFRMTELIPSVYQIISGHRYLIAEQLKNDLICFYCSDDDFDKYWYNYFDLSYDYAALVDHLIHNTDPFLSEAASYGSGIRILRQDPYETTISFILSQNKNIPAIRKSIESLCLLFGEKKEVPKADIERYISMEPDMLSLLTTSMLPDSYYAFPTPDSLAKASLETLSQTKAGYRADYIKKASKSIVSDQLILETLYSVSSSNAIYALKSLHGVGEKVANCIALFGLHHIDVFPIDVWIQRILTEEYNNNFSIASFNGYAGIVQQYMFYYKRACS